MNKYKYLLLTIFLSFILLPTIAYAEEWCGEVAEEHFKEVERQFKYTYKFDTESQTYTFNFYNPEPDNYEIVFLIEYDITCEDINNNEFTCSGFQPGKLEIEILSTDESCPAEIKKEAINLSGLNEFSKDELCKGIEEFVLCQPTYDKEIDYDTFVERTNIYRKTKAKKQQNETAKKKDTINNKLSNYISEHLITIIIIIVFIIAIVITFILTAKTIAKSRRLE